jgi:Na+/H+ antiporter NhaD/arsenite permease-like protein
MFCLSDAHKVFHWVAADMQTYFKNYTLSDNIAYKYIGFFHSIFGAFDGTGLVGTQV